MARTPQLLDRWGNPIQRKTLTTEVAGATLGGVRSPMAGYPADGLNPLRLAQILREADRGDPLRYLELAETIEERDLHYLGVLSTRKRSVAQIEISVEAGSDDPLDQDIAEVVRDWLARDELSDELFDILDAIGKGYSFTEILWDTSEGQWMPRRLEWRDPRWFRPAQKDLTTPLLITESGEEVPLPGGKFIHAVIRGKSGLPVRSGLARVASWAWMFKAFTQRDWAIFAQTYGQPLRLGKWAPGASKEDKDTLFRAVANIAGDCAAIIPESMSIEFVETGTVGASVDLYERRADWLDRQISKAVLGQTTTTDAVSGGHAVAQEHRQVQEDIERADARALAGILNRDLVRPWVQLEFGPRAHYPRIVIARPEPEDLDRLARSLGVLIPLGLKVATSEIRDRFGLSDPEAGEEVLGAPAPPKDEQKDATTKGKEVAKSGGDANEEDEDDDETGQSPSKNPALQAAGDAGARGGNDAAPVDTILADTLARSAQPTIAPMIETLGAMLDTAGSLEELRAMVLAAWPDLDTSALASRLAEGMVAADLAGRVAVADEADGPA
ncbi:DUF935 domain-containing protein [Pararhodobacter zhoushanensis]|uniref:DUF935 domain-containing protein n=1 Tax=Pararhodobacter zhoushanensis TaxID=2479545 RepID=A0ABT3H2W6_9RHOB|nr:DUF935 domain-containing protein [Pararhodobacter zhoushanensis]MCW1934111.1 DUF935 domain-containing protein [Pararhodobacter zhoushanensis]